MGLSIEVGALKDLAQHDAEGAEWLREDIAAINGLLQGAGLPEHVEPTGPDLEVLSFDMAGYDELAALRAFAAREAGDAQRAGRAFPHLIDHDDAEGYYVPTPFSEVLHDPDGEVPGGSVGSSQTLVSELEQLTDALGLTADGAPRELASPSSSRTGRRSLARPWRRRADPAPGGDSPEAQAALKLLAAARHSVDSGALLVFC